MRKLTTRALVGMLLLLSLFLVGTHAAQASSRHADVTRFYGPFAGTSPDSGTCGNFWANDTFGREFVVETDAGQVNKPVENFTDASFVTLAGSSPGACESGTNNGNTVAAGINGTFNGFFDLVITNGHYNAAAICTQATCGDTASFVSTVYGASASFTIPSFKFNYSTGCSSWQNASADLGGNSGDITC